MNTLTKGHFIRFDAQSEWRHSFGASHAIEGARCLNCELPLMLHLTLDCRDERLNLGALGVETLPLLYCMRCALCWGDFVYNVEAENCIHVLSVFEGERMSEWYEEVGGDAFAKRVISLEPVPDHVQKLFHKLNANEELTDEETLAVATTTGRFANANVGGYPIVDTVNQIGGRSFLQQRLDDPECEQCGELMPFLASLCNDPRQKFRVTYNDGQIVFFLCRQCKTIHVQSSAG